MKKTLNEMSLLMLSLMNERNDSVRVSCAECYGSICVAMNTEQIDKLLTQHILNIEEVSNVNEWRQQQSKLIALSKILEFKDNFNEKLYQKYNQHIMVIITDFLESENILVKIAASKAATSYLIAMCNNKENVENIIKFVNKHIIVLLKDNSTDIRQTVAENMSHFAIMCPAESSSKWFLNIMLPGLIKNSTHAVATVSLATQEAIVNLLQVKKSKLIYDDYLKTGDPNIAKQLQSFGESMDW